MFFAIPLRGQTAGNRVDHHLFTKTIKAIHRVGIEPVAAHVAGKRSAIEAKMTYILPNSV
jgi:hypothetical protein